MSQTQQEITIGTMADFAAMRGPNDMIGALIPILAKEHPILKDMVMVPSNMTMEHLTTLQASVPSIDPIGFNDPTPTVKTDATQVLDTMSIWSVNTKVGVAESELNGNSAQYRFNQNMGVIQGMNNGVADCMFYGNELTNKKKFTGLAPRKDDISTTLNERGFTVISAAGASSDNTSIFLVGHGANGMVGIYPKNTSAGLTHLDEGVKDDVIVDSSTHETSVRRVYRDLFRWEVGIAEINHQNSGRIANIDVSDLLTYGTSNDSSPDLLNLFDQAFVRIKSPSSVRLVAYCNRWVYQVLRAMLRTHASVLLSWGEMLNPFTGLPERTLMFDDVPIRVDDSILNTESVVA
jgi:hypothetical protein